MNEKGRHCNRYWFCDECAAAVAQALDSIENWMPIRYSATIVEIMTHKTLGFVARL